MPPYNTQVPLKDHGDKSKLLTVKQVHANHFQDSTRKYVCLLSSLVLKGKNDLIIAYENCEGAVIYICFLQGSEIDKR